MSSLQPVDPLLLFTKNDKEDPRLGECVLTSGLETTPSEYDIAILGYPDDEGIAVGGGRQGAKLGPQEIRRILYKMTPHLAAKRHPRILDLGDVSTDQALAERHEQGRKTVRSLLSKNKTWISFGGGHDYGYADGSAFLDTYADQAVILNFDAHLDVRPVTRGLSSGTPFFRLLQEFPGRFDFAEIGIQSQCNSQAHLKWAQERKAEVFLFEQIHQEGLLPVLKKYMQDKKNKKIFLSVDIDAFTSSEAPGCSQSWARGFMAQEFLPALHWLVSEHQVQGMGIYEVSPALDRDNATSKLAALLAHQFLFSHLNKS